MMNDAAYGSNSDSNPNNSNNPNWRNPPKAQANQPLGQVVPSNLAQAQAGVNPDVPKSATAPSGGGADTFGPNGSGGKYNYDFTQSPVQNGYNYLGSALGSDGSMGGGGGGGGGGRAPTQQANAVIKPAAGSDSAGNQTQFSHNIQTAESSF